MAEVYVTYYSCFNGMSRYFYLNLEIDLSGVDVPELTAQRLIQAATTELFGECCPARADILRVNTETSPSQVLVRIPAVHLRHLRAALTLAPRNIRVLSEAPTLQALI